MHTDSNELNMGPTIGVGLGSIFARRSIQRTPIQLPSYFQWLYGRLARNHRRCHVWAGRRSWRREPNEVELRWYALACLPASQPEAERLQI